MSVAIVTDSTAYLPLGLAREWGVRVVPVQVIVGSESYPETDDPDSARLSAALIAHQPVTTSRPSPELFLAAFAECLADGATQIVCVTLSSDMSATYESALLAARESGADVTVIDSRTAAMGLGFAVLAGVRVAQAGGTSVSVAATIKRVAAETSVMFYVDTLEYLRKGGRIGGASALVGHALQVKPILQIADGRVAPLEKVRTAAKAISRMVELAVTAAMASHVEIAVQDVDAPDRADVLMSQLRERLPGVSIVRSQLGAAVGAHLGPGAVAVVIAPL
jgi:DegV family protein with EDD domain